MPTLLSDQRAHHASFHPYQSALHVSTGRPRCSRSPITRAPKSAPHSGPSCPRKELPQSTLRVETKHDALLIKPSGSLCSAAPPKIHDLAIMGGSLPPSLVPVSTPPLTRQTRVPAPRRLTGHNASLIPCDTSSSLSSQVHDTSIGMLDTTNCQDVDPKHPILAQNSSSFNKKPLMSHSATVSRRSSPTQVFVSYLKSWRPPVEYYARRRHQQSALWYPSRRPSLPALLEEHVNHDGKMVLVCPELAMSTSIRVYRRKVFPRHYPYSRPASQNLTTQVWDAESDEELEADSSDEDDSVESDSDCDEAVTPTNSPASSTTYFLQPLILTKPPGC